MPGLILRIDCILIRSHVFLNTTYLLRVLEFGFNRSDLAKSSISNACLWISKDIMVGMYSSQSQIHGYSFLLLNWEYCAILPILTK